MIVLNESHLRRLVREYLEYYHDDRIHDALKKEAPILRVVERRPRGTAKVVSAPRRRIASSLSLASRGLKVGSSGPLLLCRVPLNRINSGTPGQSKSDIT